MQIPHSCLELTWTTSYTRNPDPSSSNVMSQHLFLLGGSWVVISGDISKVTIVIIHIRGLITPLVTTHEPPSR